MALKQIPLQKIVISNKNSNDRYKKNFDQLAKSSEEFNVEVADKPVNPTTSAGVTVPRVVVALKPVKLNTADSTDPQPF